MIDQIATPVVFLGGTAISRHNSALAPQEFTFQRKDFDTTNYANYAGFVQVRIATTDTSLFTVGDSVYFYASDNINEVKGVATVDLISVTTYTVITISLPYLAFTPITQFINLTEVYYNYEADIEYYDLRTDEKIAAESRKPDETGLIRFDAASFLKDFTLTESFDFSAAENDLQVMKPFYFKIGETYLTTTTAPTRIDLNDYFSVHYDPIFRSRGSNLGDELGFPGGSGLQQGLFLTDFEEPRAFEGWPFSLSFMYSPNGVIDNLFLAGKEYDNNGTLLNSSEVAIVVDDLTEVIKTPVFPSGKQPQTCFILAAITGSATFAFLTIFDPATDGTFDPAIATSSGVADWRFEDLSLLSGNSISSTGNGLDGTSQEVRIENLDPSVITSIDFSNDKISGAFDASSLVNCPIFRLSNNEISGFDAGKTDHSITELDLSNNPNLTSVDISSMLSLTGSLDLSSGNLGNSGLLLPVNNLNTFTTFNFSGNALGYFNIGSSFPNVGKVNGCQIDLANNGMNQSEVNAFLLDLNRIIPSGYTGRDIYIDGSNAAPNLAIPSVLAAITGLNGKNVDVFYTGFVP